MQRPFFALLLVLSSTALFAQATFARYALEDTGFKSRRIFITAEGQYFLAGMLGPELLDVPVVTAFSPAGEFMWRNDFLDSGVWNGGPRYVFETNGNEVLVIGTYGIECDLVDSRGVKVVPVDRQSGAILSEDYFLAVHELPGMSDAVYDRELLANYHPDSDLLLLWINERFVINRPLTAPKSLALLPLLLESSYPFQFDLVGADSILMASGNQLLAANLQDTFARALSTFPARIDHMLRVGETIYVLSDQRLWSYTAAAGSVPLIPTTATRIAASGEKLILHRRLSRYRFFDPASLALGPSEEIPGGVRVFTIRDDRYYLAKDHLIGLSNPGTNGFAQTGLLSELGIQSDWDLNIVSTALDSIRYIGTYNSYYDSLGTYADQLFFRWHVSFEVLNDGLDTLRGFTFRWEPRYPPGLVCGFVNDWSRFSGLNLAPGEHQTFYKTGYFSDIYRQSGVYRDEFGFCIDIPNQDIDLRGENNCAVFQLTDLGSLLPLSARVDITPNPTQQAWRVAWEASAFAEYRLTDAYGRVVRRGLLPSAANEFTLPAADLPAGVYLLQLLDRSGRALTRKLIKQ